MRLRTNLFLMVLGTVLPLIAIAVVLMTLLVGYERDSNRRGAIDRVRAVMTAVDAELRGTIGTLQVLGTSERLKTGDFAAFRQEALNVLGSQPQWISISVLRPSGEQVFNTAVRDGAALPAVTSDPATTTRAAEGKQAAVGNVSMGPFIKELGLPVRAPILIDGDVRYVLSAHVRMNSFQRLIEAQQLLEGWVFGLVDSTGRFIARKPQAPSLVATEEFMRHAQGAREGWYRGRTVDGFETFSAHVTSPLSGWSLGHAIPIAQIYAPAIRAAALLGVGVVAIIALAFGFAYWMSRRITAPVSALVSSARSLGGGEAPAQSNIEEVHALEQALQESAKKVRSELLDRAAAEHALQNEKQRLEAVMDALPVGVAITNTEGGVVQSNRAFEQIWRGPRPAVRTIADRAAYEARWTQTGKTVASEEWASIQAVQKGEPVVGQLLEIRRFDGSRAFVVNSAAPVRNAHGTVVGAAVAIQDISQHKRTQETVALLSQAIESAANSIVLTERNGRIIWVNPAFTQATGYSLEEAVGHTPRLLKSGRQPPEFYKNLWDTILNGDTWRGQLINRRKDGSLYNEQMSITPVRSEGAGISHFVSVREDITARLETLESLRAARISADEANQAKDRFIAVLSHELRTPLTPVLAAVQLLQRIPDLSAAMHDSLEIISRNVQLEARLIDDLLDLTRIVQGKLLLERKPMNLCTAIERAVEICKPDIDARQLHLEVDLKGRPHRVDGDVSRLQQVIWNLLANAVKFTPEGGTIGVRCYREDAHAVVEVVDTGIGIEPAALSRIFSAFEQAEPGITRQFGGLGLGLAIAKRLVEMHEGTIAAHSEGSNRGSTFQVALPLSSAELAAEPDLHARTVPGPPRRILLVEDNADSAAMLKLLLEAFGCEIETAGDVVHALKAIDSQDFDLVISDLGLPGQSGLDLMRELRRRGNSVKGIALSGYGREEDVRGSRQAGFSEHLTKPVDADILEEAVWRLLGGQTLV